MKYASTLRACLISLLILAIAGFGPKLFANGTDSSGGGDKIISNSTPEEVKAEIARVKLFLAYHFNMAVAPDQKNVKNPHLQKMLTRLLAGGTPNENLPGGLQNTAVQFDIEATRFLVKEDGPCLTSSGLEVDASVETFSLGSPICLSVSRLKNMPREALYPQIMALTAHEIAHHFGYDEANATLLQRYFLEEIMTDKSFFRNSVKNSVHVIFQLAQESFEMTTCEKTTNLQNEFVNLKQTVSGIGYNRGLQHPEFYKAFAETKITSLQTESRNIRKSACQGDSPQARNALVLLIDQINKLNESIIDELFPRQL